MSLTSVKDLFVHRKYREATEELKKDNYKEEIESDGMEAVATLFNAAIRTARTEKEIAYSKESLEFVLSLMNPKEALMAISENLGAFPLGSKLYVVLKSICVCLSKMADAKLDKHLLWNLLVLFRQFKKTKLPSELQQKTRVEPQKLIRLEVEYLSENVINPSRYFVQFFTSWLRALSDLQPKIPAEVFSKCQNISLVSIAKLLEYPLGHCPFDFTWEPSQDLFVATESPGVQHQPPNLTVAGFVAKTIVFLLNSHGMSVSTIYQHLDHRGDDLAENVDCDDDKNATDDESSLDFDNVAVVSYLYIMNICFKGMEPCSKPYSPKYNFTRSMQLMVDLVPTELPEIHFKAVHVCETYLRSLCPNTPYLRLEAGFLQTDLHKNFLHGLCRLITYSEDASVRKLGAKVFRSYIWAFEARGRYELVLEILSSSLEDTIIGFIITQLKDFFHHAICQSEGKTRCQMLKQQVNIFPDMTAYFTGKNLGRIFQALNVPAIDPTASNSRVMSVLNLIRFMIIRDKKNVANSASSRDRICAIVKGTRNSLTICKLQAQAQLNQLHDPSALSALKNGTNIDFKVQDKDGSDLKRVDEMTKEDMEAACQHVLSNLDMIECVLVHTEQCLASLQ